MKLNGRMPDGQWHLSDLVTGLMDLQPDAALWKAHEEGELRFISDEDEIVDGPTTSLLNALSEAALVGPTLKADDDRDCGHALQRLRYIDATHRLSRFDWRKRSSRNAFRGLLRAFAGSLGQYDVPDLASEEVALRFFLATGGIMDFVVKILVFAELIARQSGMTKLTMALFAQAWRTVLFHSTYADYDPFACELGEDIERKIETALRINHEVAPSSKPTRSRKNSTGSDLLRQAGL